MRRVMALFVLLCCALAQKPALGNRVVVVTSSQPLPKVYLRGQAPIAPNIPPAHAVQRFTPKLKVRCLRVC